MGKWHLVSEEDDGSGGQGGGRAEGCGKGKPLGGQKQSHRVFRDSPF